MIKCKKCHQYKSETEFYLAKRGKTRRESSCKNCRNKIKYAKRREKRIANGLNVRTIPATISKELLNQHQKYCPRCKIIKNVSEFSTMKVRNKISSHCKQCGREMLNKYYNTSKGRKASKQKYVRNKIKYKNSTLKRKFGITLNEYNMMLKAQNHGCAICGKTKKRNGRMLAVDHCHKTKKNRALLCSKCNIIIGFIEYNKLDIDDIKNYMVKHKINKNTTSSHPRS